MSKEHDELAEENAKEAEENSQEITIFSSINVTQIKGQVTQKN
jgi:hypothetical protein